MTDKSKIIKISEGAYQHWCPGCKAKHMFFTKECTLIKKQKHSEWNEDYNNPTVIPSIRHDFFLRNNTVCHYRIYDGKIIYTDDTTHEYRGQMIELPDTDHWE